MALEAVFTFLDIRQSLSHENTGDMYGVSGGGANTVEVRSELGANGSIGKVAFYRAELALGVILPPVELNLLALYRLEFTLMRLIPIDISDNTRVLEIYNGIVDEESRGGGRVEDIEVIILDPRAVEIGRGMCPCVERDRVFRVSPLANPYKMSVNSNLPKGDVSCYFILTILIEEDEGVLLRITAVILAPSVSWVVWVVKLVGKLRNIGDRARHGR